jgi:hypothetical protein
MTYEELQRILYGNKSNQVLPTKLGVQDIISGIQSQYQPIQLSSAVQQSGAGRFINQPVELGQGQSSIQSPITEYGLKAQNAGPVFKPGQFDFDTYSKVDPKKLSNVISQISSGSDSGSFGSSGRAVDDAGLATASTISPTGVRVGAMGLSLLTGLPISLLANLVGVNKIADYMNTTSYNSAVDYNLDKAAEQLGLPNTPDNRAALSSVVDSLSATNPNTPAATPGVGGTGGAAASAGATAASAATAAGHSPAGIAAASQAAANAVVSGKSPSEAAQLASDAAATADGGTTGPGSATGVGVGSTSGINSMDAQSDAAASTSTDSSTSDTTDSGGKSGDTAGFAKGGKVLKSKLSGKNPKGKDDGYAALDVGEYVIQKSSVDKYGDSLLSLINEGKISKKKLQSLI